MGKSSMSKLTDLPRFEAAQFENPTLGCDAIMNGGVTSGPEGRLRVEPKDWIITGVADENYPASPTYSDGSIHPSIDPHFAHSGTQPLRPLSTQTDIEPPLLSAIGNPVAKNAGWAGNFCVWLYRPDPITTAIVTAAGVEDDRARFGQPRAGRAQPVYIDRR